ncbi:unnamed protein product [Caretta caretta]
MILGNNLANVLHGGKGSNSLPGYNGKDMYVVEKKNSCDHINNFASDGEIDLVQLETEYDNVAVELTESSLQVRDTNSLIYVTIDGWKQEGNGSTSSMKPLALWFSKYQLPFTRLIKE